MRILAFTDFHGNSDAFQNARETIVREKPDLVLVAGDVANHDAEKARRSLVNLAGAESRVYFVPGNMDSVELLGWKGIGNVRGLHGRYEYWNSTSLVGLGGSPHGVFSTPIEYDEELAAKVLDRAMEGYHGGNLILVSHCPPRDTKVDQVATGQHIGSISVREFIKRAQPTLVVSGHVHEAQGDDKIGSTVIVNTGPAKNGNYARINIDQDVAVEFAKFR
jgi:hypothetical protein